MLTPADLDRLGDRDLGSLLRYVKPEHAQIVAVEEDGEIAAHVGILQVTHFEGLYIKPEQRGNAGVFRALIRGAFDIPRQRGECWAIGAAEKTDERMETLCRRLGGHELPVKFYAIGVS